MSGCNYPGGERQYSSPRSELSGEIVQGGNFPGVIAFGKNCLRGNFRGGGGGNCPMWELSGGAVTVQGGNCPGAIVQGQLSGRNCLMEIVLEPPLARVHMENFNLF